MMQEEVSGIDQEPSLVSVGTFPSIAQMTCSADGQSARKTLALRIKKFRIDRHWSQEYLGFEAGLDRTFIAHVERGVRNASIDNIERIAMALGVPVHLLLMPSDVALQQ